MTDDIKAEADTSSADTQPESGRKNQAGLGIYLLKCLFLALFVGLLGSVTYFQFFTEKLLFPFPGIKEQINEEVITLTDNDDNIEKKKTFSASLFFISPDMQSLERVDKELVFGSNNLENARRIIETLLKGPEDKTLISPFTENVRIRTIFIYKDVLYVDFNRSIMKLKNTSALRENFMISSIIKSVANTVSDIKNIKFLINGKSSPTFFKSEGHIDISGMFSVN